MDSTRACSGTRRRARWGRLLAVTMLVALPVLGSGDNASASGPYIFWFNKNYNDRLNSTLFWTNNDWTESGGWRAGSGRNTDECRRSDVYPYNQGGWLPNGYWTVWFASVNYNGNVIKGPAIRFYDRPCSNGTWRTEIFIHSKIPWPQPNGEYFSQGCVKVSSTGATPATASGDVRTVYDVKMFLGINNMLVG